MTKTIEAIENALTFLEALGYRGGDIHDDLAAALERLRKREKASQWATGVPPEKLHLGPACRRHKFEFSEFDRDTCCVCGKSQAWSAHR
jgi:hypothetical protein